MTYIPQMLTFVEYTIRSTEYFIMNNIKGTENNPFLQQYRTPHDAIPFDRIALEHFIPALKEGIRQETECIENICNNSDAPTFDNTIAALEEGGMLISDVMCAFNALINARSYDEILKIEEEIQQLYTEHRNNISLNEALFNRIKSVYKQSNHNLSNEQKRLLQETYKSFTRGGADLKGEAREKYRILHRTLTALSLKFQENIVKDTDEFELHITEKENLEGLPQDVTDAAANTANERNKKGWIFTLHRPSYLPFITYCKNRELRRTMYIAYNTIGAKGNAYDNRDIVKQTVNTRLELARLLNFESYSDYILAERMAKNTDAVYAMLGKLTWVYLQSAKNEVAEIEAYAKECEEDNFEFMPWDFAYYSEKLKEKKFDISDEKIRPYLNLEQAIYGAFYLATRMYGITFKENDEIPTYHPDVKVWEVYDYDGSYLALLYCDFYAREGKHAGAWMDSLKPQYKDADGNNHRPHVTLSTNYRKPLHDKPTLLNFDELNTLMHEFGHCLHGILSNVTYASQCSPNVLWDFVEMPSQIMENFVIEEEFLKIFAFNYKTGETIPDELIKNIRKSHNFKAAYQCIRQVALGLIDQSWHTITEPFDGDVLEHEHQTTASLKLMNHLPQTGITPQFSHIISGGYAAGYYSYKWAEMLDADAFSLFKEKGILNMQVAQSFRENILSRGDTEHPMELYLRFRGRKPRIEPLLQRDGIK